MFDTYDAKGGSYRPLVVATDSEGIVPSLQVIIHAPQFAPPFLPQFGIEPDEPGVCVLFEVRRPFGWARATFNGEVVLSLRSQPGIAAPPGFLTVVAAYQSLSDKQQVAATYFPDVEGGYVYRRP